MGDGGPAAPAERGTATGLCGAPPFTGERTKTLETRVDSKTGGSGS